MGFIRIRDSLMNIDTISRVIWSAYIRKKKKTEEVSDSEQSPITVVKNDYQKVHFSIVGESKINPEFELARAEVTVYFITADGDREGFSQQHISLKDDEAIALWHYFKSSKEVTVLID